MEQATVELPAGFSCHVANIGIKDDTADFVVLADPDGNLFCVINAGEE